MVVRITLESHIYVEWSPYIQSQIPQECVVLDTRITNLCEVFTLSQRFCKKCVVLDNVEWSGAPRSGALGLLDSYSQINGSQYHISSLLTRKPHIFERWQFTSPPPYPLAQPIYVHQRPRGNNPLTAYLLLPLSMPKNMFLKQTSTISFQQERAFEEATISCIFLFLFKIFQPKFLYFYKHGDRWYHMLCTWGVPPGRCLFSTIFNRTGFSILQLQGTNINLPFYLIGQNKGMAR